MESRNNTTSKFQITTVTGAAEARTSKKAETDAAVRKGWLSFVGASPLTSPAGKSAALVVSERTTLVPPQPPEHVVATPAKGINSGDPEPGEVPIPLSAKSASTPGQGMLGEVSVLPGARTTPSLYGGILAPAEGQVLRGSPPADITAAVFNASPATRPSVFAAEKFGGNASDIMHGMSPFQTEGFIENSMVEANIFALKAKTPARFHKAIDEAIGAIHANLAGAEPLVIKFMVERRWNWKEEDAFSNRMNTVVDEIERVFSRTYDSEAQTRIKSGHEGKGVFADTEKNFAFAILKSNHPGENSERCVFDAFAKGVMFAYLIKQRPGSYLEAIGHPEISKPYGGKVLGGVEGAGIGAGLRGYPDNLEIASLFRCYRDTKLLTIANDLRDRVVNSKSPARPLVGKFEDMVRSDVRSFEEAVRTSGISPEMFFSLMNETNTEKTFEGNEQLKAAFRAAAKEGLIYSAENDLFDAINLINDYKFALKENQNPTARDMFVKFSLANYSLGQDDAFYKLFCMCLFNSTDELRLRPILKYAFEHDQNETVRKCFALRVETLEAEERPTVMLGQPATPATARAPVIRDETDFGDLGD